MPVQLDLMAALALAVASAVAIGHVLKFFVQRLDRYVPREEYENTQRLLLSRIESVHESIHEVRNLLVKLMSKDRQHQAAD